jgi:two-component sensor histidine kinase
MNDGSRIGDNRTLRFLLLEDSDLDAELIREALVSTGLAYTVERVLAHADFARAIDCSDWDLILADYVLPSFDGLSALTIARERCPEIPFVFVSGMLGEEIAVEALKRGATDYVLKQRLERLSHTVLRALSEARERAERQRAQEALQQLLEERTGLLHELDHRVKNNLQLLLSLVNMEIRQSGTADARSALARVKERVQALAAAHRELYDGRAANSVDLAHFARSLCDELVASADRLDLQPTYDLSPALIPAGRVAPLALLMNEIVSSALSNAYAGRRGQLRITLAHRDGGYRLEMSDEHFSGEEKRAASQGASGLIVQGLARQLDAVVEWPQDEPRVLVRLTLPALEGEGAS